MIVEVTQVGRGRSLPYRGTVNGEPFVNVAGFCWLVAGMATPNDGCIKGIGKPKPNGYHQLNSPKFVGTQHAFVRAMFEGLDQPPPGLDAAHGPCNDPGCINPHHVSFKTKAENQRDRLRDGTHLAGENHPMAKISDAEHDEIRRLHATGRYTQRELGQRFGISQRRVGQILNPPTWSIEPMTLERAALIRFLAWSGAYTYRQIAEAVNTTEQQVANIKRGRSWNPTQKQAVRS